MTTTTRRPAASGWPDGQGGPGGPTWRPYDQPGAYGSGEYGSGGYGSGEYGPEEYDSYEYPTMHDGFVFADDGPVHHYPGPHRRHHRGARLVVVIPVLLLALATYSWWKVVHLTGPGAILTAAGQWTGLAATVFALCTMALMARVPVITQGVGVDTAIRWHRWLAAATMISLPVHIAATVLGYAALGKTNFTTQFTMLLTSTPQMLTATTAAGLFTLVALTSIRIVRRRFRYQTWLFIHWYSYFAITLAYGHEVAVGASFIGAPWPTVAWTWLHFFVGGLFLWYRVLKPLIMMLGHPLHVAAVQQEGPNSVSLRLRGEDLDEYGIEAGHHVRVRFITRNGWWQSHPFSLSAAPTRDEWRITVVGAGDHTKWMQGVKAGIPVLVSGAYGHLTPSSRRGQHVALIGGGSGITPLLAMLEAMPLDVDVQVLYRSRNWEDVIHAQELDELTAARGGNVSYLLGSRHPDPRQDVLSPGSLRQLLPDITSRDVYVCGLAGFVETVSKSLKTLRVPSKQIHLERYDP